jgi:flagellin
MRELAVQAANGTETDNDRSNLQDEIEQLQEELDRIASDTEFNTMPLLDGSLSAASSSVASAGPKFGVYDTGLQAFVTSDVSGVEVHVANNAAQGGESALWDPNGRTLTINLVKDQTYTQQEIDALIQNAKQEDSTAVGTPADVKVQFYFSAVTATSTTCSNSGAPTVPVKRAESDETFFKRDNGATALQPGEFVGATGITLTSQKYGADYNITVNIVFDAAVNDEECELVTAAQYNTDGSLGTAATYELHLSSGNEYSEDDIESIFAAAGLNLDVTLSGPDPDAPNTLFITRSDYKAEVALGKTATKKGDGLGDDDAYLGQAKYGGVSGGKGITLQVGANEGQTMSFSIGDMSANALGVNPSKVNVKTQKGASDGIKYIDEAIEKVSKQRSLLGAVQNRLEHTIANLDNTAENLQAAESTVRDVDMAEEMVQFSKNNILQQAGQSMLAQANQSTQGVLSLLQG